jgi:GrpB-like predicted nucleotidyltransferase (UPF0157 family)
MLGLEKDLVKLSQYSAEWQDDFNHQKVKLNSIIGNFVQEVIHVGSTSIKGLKSKPIIDIMIGASCEQNLQEIVDILKANSYIYVGEMGVPGRIFFKVNDQNATIAHLHLTIYGSKFWTDLITFKQILNSDSRVVADYIDLKENLASKYANNRSLYTAGKAKFIQETLVNYYAMHRH